MAQKAQNVELAVRVLLLREEGKWVAQCLEYDVAAQADDIDGVKKAFHEALASQACVNLHHGKKAMEDVPEAPSFYHELFKRANMLKEPALPKIGPSRVDISVKEMGIAA